MKPSMKLLLSPFDKFGLVHYIMIRDYCAKKEKIAIIRDSREGSDFSPFFFLFLFFSEFAFLRKAEIDLTI